MSSDNSASRTPRDLRQVDLNLLVAFDALMTERSVTAAAERMSVGQSTMSATLSRLRRLFDDPLMVRRGQTMTVTPTAAALADPVREILTEIRSVLAPPGGFDPATDRRSFTVMAGDYEAVAVLHPLLTNLAVEAPNVQLLIQPMRSGFAELLARDQIDMLMVPREVLPNLGTYRHEVLYTDRHVLAADASNRHVRSSISIERFSSMPYVATHYELRPALADIHLNRLGIPTNVQVTASFLLAPFLLRGTRLITITSEMLGRKLAAALELRLIDPPMELPPLTASMVWTPRAEDDPAHAWLRDRIRSVAHQANG